MRLMKNKDIKGKLGTQKNKALINSRKTRNLYHKGNFIIVHLADSDGI